MKCDLADKSKSRDWPDHRFPCVGPGFEAEDSCSPQTHLSCGLFVFVLLFWLCCALSFIVAVCHNLFGHLLTELGSNTQCAVELTIRSSAWCFVSPITSRARIGLASSSQVSDQAVSGDLRRLWVWSNTLELCLICASACDCAFVLWLL